METPVKNILLLIFVFFILLSCQIFSQWTAVNNGIPANKATYDIAVSGQTLFVTTYSNGIYKSTNNGDSWAASNSGLSGMALFAAQLKIVGNQIFAGTIGGVFKSADNGQSWTPVTNGLPAASTKDIVSAIAASGSNIYIGYLNGNGMYKSTDNGSSWTKCFLPSSLYIQGVNSLVTKGDTVVAGFAFVGGLFVSTDAGQNWKDISPGSQIANKTIGPISFVVSDLYVGTGEDPFGNGCFYKSTDLGNTWSQLIVGSISTQYAVIPTSLMLYNSNFLIGTAYGIQLYNINSSGRKDISDGLPLANPNGAKTTVPEILMNSTYAFAVMDSGGVFRRNLSNIVTGISDNKIESPVSFNLNQNFPNPFNPTTTINFQIPSASKVSLKIYDVLGREVALLVNEYKTAGKYSVNFNANNLPSGVYLYNLQAENYVEPKKMILLK